MDKETFEKVAKISEDIKSLQSVIKTISRNAFLSFVEGKGRSYGYEVPFTSTQKDAIKDILSKHGAEIRKEIENRYNALKKQIEEL